MNYQCPHCNWTGKEPSPAEYPNTPEGGDVLTYDQYRFAWEQENHKCKED